VKIMDTDGDSKRRKTRICPQNLPLPRLYSEPLLHCVYLKPDRRTVPQWLRDHKNALY